MIKTISEIKPGDVFTFGGYEWIKLEQEGLALTKDVVDNWIFDEKSNHFASSNIKNHLEKNFYNRLINNGAQRSDFKVMVLDFTADDGTESDSDTIFYNFISLVGLMTADLYRKNRRLLSSLKLSWWLATPESYNDVGSSSVLVINSNGLIATEHIKYCKWGVRPLCKLSDETEVEVDYPEEETETENITELIKKWAVDRNVVSGDPKAQMVKLLEEAGELAEGINKDKRELVIDSIGDVYVVLVILCMQLGLDINDCIKAAYEEIKDRKGKLVNGLFVKEEDL